MKYETERERILAEALAYYADPMTYFAIAMFGDSPHGDFLEDFEEYPFPGQFDIRNKPGKKAREALRQAFTLEDIDEDDEPSKSYRMSDYDE